MVFTFSVDKHGRERTIRLDVPREWFNVFELDDDILDIKVGVKRWTLYTYGDWGIKDDECFRNLTDEDFYDILELIYLLVKSGVKRTSSSKRFEYMRNRIYCYGDFFYGAIGESNVELFERSLKIYES